MSANSLVDILSPFEREMPVTKEELDQIAALFEKAQRETMRHFDVVAEGLRSEIRLIAEGHTVLVEKIGALEGCVGRLEERMERVEIKVVALEQKVDALDRKVGALEQKVDVLDRKVGALDEKLDRFIADTSANFDDVRSAIKFSYAELDRRVSQLENIDRKSVV